jgi:hypothetical protein
MRAAFGLISLLLGVFLMLWLFAGPGGLGGSSVTTALEVKKQVTPQVNQIAGRSHDGSEIASETIRLREDLTGSKARIIVSDIKPMGAMEIQFGFQRGDRLLEIGVLEVGQMITSADEANDFLLDAYSRQYQVLVDRNGQRVSLPTDSHKAKIKSLIAQKERAAQLAAQAQAAAATTQPVETHVDGLLEGFLSKPGK